MGGVRKGLEQVLHVLPQQAVAGDRFLVGGELRLGGQLAVEQQPGDLEERRLRRQLLDRIPPIAKDSLLTVDEGDRGGALRGIAEPSVEGDETEL
jgi:hypothetical protein